MKSFKWWVPTQIYFGRDEEKKVGDLVREYGSRALIHYGGSFAKQSGLVDRISSYLHEAGVEYIELGGVKPNPRLSLVRKGIELCRENAVDFILAVGGGSVIDSAKAIALGVEYEGDVWDFFCGKVQVTKIMPLGSVLTIPAAGSEVSLGTVVTNEEGWYKRNVNHPIIRPKFAILNPELTNTLSPYQTACGVADMMSHVMETYFTNVSNVEFSDHLCEATLRTMICNARCVKNNLQDYDARAELMWSATVAQMSLFSAGRVGDWASHSIESELSAIYDIPHGEGMAIIMPAWMRHVCHNNVERFVQFATKVWNVDASLFATEQEVALTGIDRLSQFFREIGLAVTLGECKITAERFDEMASKACENGNIGNLTSLDKKDIIEIYQESL